MAEAIPAEEQSNYEIFRDCLSEPVLKALAIPQDKPRPRKKRHAKKRSKDKNGNREDFRTEVAPVATAQASDTEDLGEFIEVCQSLQHPLIR
jgi:hypothetical protein